MSASRDRVLAVAEPVVNAAGYDLDELQVMAAGRRRLVRVMIDSDNGVDLDEAAAVSRAVSEALDDSDAMGQTPYVLEVTSRGVDRPLTIPRHWRRAATRLVKVTRVDGEVVTGRIIISDDEGVHLDIDGADVALAYAEIDKAVVQVEFNRRATAESDEPDTDEPDTDEPDTDEPDADEPDSDDADSDETHDETGRV